MPPSQEFYSDMSSQVTALRKWPEFLDRKNKIVPCKLSINDEIAILAYVQAGFTGLGSGTIRIPTSIDFSRLENLSTEEKKLFAANQSLFKKDESSAEHLQNLGVKVGFNENYGSFTCTGTYSCSLRDPKNYNYDLIFRRTSGHVGNLDVIPDNMRPLSAEGLVKVFEREFNFKIKPLAK